MQFIFYGIQIANKSAVDPTTFIAANPESAHTNNGNQTIEVVSSDDTILENAEALGIGSLNHTSTWTIVLIAIAVILFFLCLVICLIRDDFNIISARKSSKKKRSPIKVKHGKKYEECKVSYSNGDDTEYGLGQTDRTSASDLDQAFCGGEYKPSAPPEHVVLNRTYWEPTKDELRALKLI